jgi:hypothetical protein
MSIQQ